MLDLCPRRRLTKHHLTPQCHYKVDYRPAVNSPENILLLHLDKHTAWHQVFKEATIEQAIKVLQRVARMKRRKTAA